MFGVVFDHTNTMARLTGINVALMLFLLLQINTFEALAINSYISIQMLRKF